jgi:hypothetical protein
MEPQVLVCCGLSARDRAASMSLRQSDVHKTSMVGQNGPYPIASLRLHFHNYVPTGFSVRMTIDAIPVLWMHFVCAGGK